MQVIPARISLKQFYQCRDKEIVMLTVSMTHPRRSWQVYHVNSPTKTFLIDKNYLWVVE